MSVTTTADEKMGYARQKIQEALEAVNEAHTAINITPVWGAEEYSIGFKQDLAEGCRMLLEFKNDMNG